MEGGGGVCRWSSAVSGKLSKTLKDCKFAYRLHMHAGHFATHI